MTTPSSRVAPLSELPCGISRSKRRKKRAINSAIRRSAFMTQELRQSLPFLCSETEARAGSYTAHAAGDLHHKDALNIILTRLASLELKLDVMLGHADNLHKFDWQCSMSNIGATLLSDLTSGMG
eukprot:4191966-Karenia_brevis.AAC.1